MLTIRFPTGLTVEYVRANFVKWCEGRADLYTADPAKGGVWVATVHTTSGCIIESQPANYVHNPIAQPVDLIRQLRSAMRTLPYSQRAALATLKRELQDFNAQTKQWKPSKPSAE